MVCRALFIFSYTFCDSHPNPNVLLFSVYHKHDRTQNLFTLIGHDFIGLAAGR